MKYTLRILSAQVKPNLWPGTEWTSVPRESLADLLCGLWDSVAEAEHSLLERRWHYQPGGTWWLPRGSLGFGTHHGLWHWVKDVIAQITPIGGEPMVSIPDELKSPAAA